MVSQKITFSATVGRSRRIEIAEGCNVTLKITNKYSTPSGNVQFEATVIGSASQISSAISAIREAEQRGRNWLESQKVRQADFKNRARRYQQRQQVVLPSTASKKEAPKKAQNMFSQLDDPSVKNLRMEPYIGSEEYNEKKAAKKATNTKKAKQHLAKAGLFEPLSLDGTGKIVSSKKSFCWADLV